MSSWKVPLPTPCSSTAVCVAGGLGEDATGIQLVVHGEFSRGSLDPGSGLVTEAGTITRSHFGDGEIEA